MKIHVAGVGGAKADSPVFCFPGQDNSGTMDNRRSRLNQGFCGSSKDEVVANAVSRTSAPNATELFRI